MRRFLRGGEACVLSTLCKFMIQLGRYEELGSGVRRVNQYLPHYAPGAGKPVFEDGDMFKVIVPLAADMDDGTPQVTPQVLAVLRTLISAPRTREELHEMAGIKDREHLRKAYLEPLLADGLIERTIPDKPTSRLQKYRLTEKGRARIKNAP